MAINLTPARALAVVVAVCVSAMNLTAQTVVKPPKNRYTPQDVELGREAAAGGSMFVHRGMFDAAVLPEDDAAAFQETFRRIGVRREPARFARLLCGLANRHRHGHTYGRRPHHAGGDQRVL
jgi:hypothetical protein